MSKRIKTNYFGVTRLVSCAKADNVPFGNDDVKFKTLGEKIVEATKYGADLGSPTPVSGDSDDTGVDVMSSPNHDFFDIAEEFGRLVDLTPSAPAETE